MEHRHVVVIGAGQAGLATGHHLRKNGEDFLLLDAAGRIGDAWRARWDSLHLFTPSQYDGLPGMPFPSARGSFPSKDEMAGYLEDYARKNELPVRCSSPVEHLSLTPEGFEIESPAGRLSADRVVVATGANPRPHIPSFAGELNGNIFQLHSSRYRNPEALPEGEVLVVGAGTSGVEIALELSKDRQVSIAGHPTFHIPDPVFRYAGRLYWWFASNVLTIRTPVGRKARPKIIGGGGPLIRVSEKDLDAAGIRRLPRVAGVVDGLPQLADGQTLNPAVIVWATGYRPDFSWIKPDVTEASGWPRAERGVSKIAAGLYFVGMPFQFGLTSALVGGVGRDASYVAKHIHRSGNGRAIAR